jgi:hypothetical protein
MAAAAWRLYAKAKEYIGDGTITLGTGGFKLALFSGSSSASTLTFSTFSQLSTRQASGGAYVAGGKYLVPSAGTWTLAGSTITFDYTSLGITFTASGSNISAVQYAVIYKDGRQANSFAGASFLRRLLSVSDPNTLTVLPAATGVFTLT